jgi:hypothetical protein
MTHGARGSPVPGLAEVRLHVLTGSEICCFAESAPVYGDLGDTVTAVGRLEAERGL